MADRPLIVMLPALGLDAAMYAPLARALDGDADVLALDYPGFGRDDGAPAIDEDDGADVLAAIARGVVRRVQAADRAPAILGGLSLGGTVALMAAEVLRPSALLLVAAGGLRVAEARKRAIADAMASAEPEAFALRSLGLVGDAFDASPFRAHFASPTADVQAYWEHLVNETWAAARIEGRAATYTALLRAATAVDLGERMRASEIPADVVWGDDDRVFSARVRDRYVATLRGGRLHRLAGGHFLPLEAPEALAAIVRERLDEAGLTGR